MSEVMQALYEGRHGDAEAAAADTVLDVFEHVRILLARGADVDGRQASGHTALDEARIRGDQPLIDLLTTHGAAS